MKRFLYTLCITIVSSWGFLSCLSDSDTTEYTVYDDTAITQMQILSINRYIHTTTTAGKDTTYKKTITSSSNTLPGFTIDQEKKTIYNTDSLPYDADLSRVVILLTGSTYTGQIYVKSLANDDLFPYSSSDSIDFNSPREIRAYNNNLTKYRAYTVSVNKHQVVTNAIIWEKMPNAEFPEDVIKTRWEQIASDAGMGSFIGYGSGEGYAYDADGKLMVSRDGGTTWNPDNVIEDGLLLPRRTFSFTSYPQVTNDSTDYQLLVGTVSEKDSICTVWRKIAEYSERSIPSKWVNIPMEYYNNYALPVFPNLHLVNLHGNILAFGSTKSIYNTRDGGITWKVSDKFKYPKDYTYPDNMEVLVDYDDYLWLKDNDQNIIWRGQLIDD